jgi:hypothetical protein
MISRWAFTFGIALHIREPQSRHELGDRLRNRQITQTWNLPFSSPDMGGVSNDGSKMWLSGRYNAEVYAIDTRGGRLRARIPVGPGTHGLCVWTQPGRYSHGHTQILR